MSRLPGVLFFAAIGLLLVSCGRVPDTSSATRLDTPPRIDPDYASLVIPPNIAPLNFRIKEVGRDYVVKISSDAAPPLEVHSPDGTVRIGLKAWRAMLGKNKGRNLYYDIYVKRQDGGWVQFQRVTNTVAEESIDSCIVYRLVLPNKAVARIKGLYQTNLETSESSALMTLRDGTFECFNCHTFHQHNPDRFLLHVRVQHSGMLLVMDGKTRKVNTQQSPMFRPLAYASWHPDGRHIAATLNRYFCSYPARKAQYYFQAVDKRGDLVVYDVETNTVSTTRPVFENEYIESHPCWSHDGKHIYFVRAKDKVLLVPEDWNKFKFDMMRISYDTATDTWGSPETVMAYSELGKSCAFPRPSPDGKYVLHILSDQTNYPINQITADLYVLDLETKEYRKLDKPSSDLAESYPRWSSNGRWFSFLSNREDGKSALPYFAYFDALGQAHKAFVLPQKDPAYYDTFMDTYNVLELVKSRVTIKPFDLASGMQKEAEGSVFPNPPEVDARTGATPTYWQ